MLSDEETMGNPRMRSVSERLLLQVIDPVGNPVLVDQHV
jgi:hypothetical protein